MECFLEARSAAFKDVLRDVVMDRGNPRRTTEWFWFRAARNSPVRPFYA